MEKPFIENEDKFQVFPNILGADDLDTSLIINNIRECINYLNIQSWYEKILEIKLGYGCGGVIVVILVTFERPISSSDDRLWVIGGDLPNAYLVLDRIRSVKAALKEYVRLMREWCDSVFQHRSVSDNFPIDAIPSIENAMSLKKRMDFIEERLLKDFAD